jgi:hypothetical protein
MTAYDVGGLARRCLLGQADEAEQVAFEDAMFRDPSVMERAEAAEEALIEDYLNAQLSEHDRARFERHFLTAPHRRRRVDAVRRLLATAKRERSIQRPPVWLATAAALVLLAGTWWFYASRRGMTPHAPAAAARSAPGADRHLPDFPPPTPRIFATSLSPISVRGADESSVIVIPEGTDLVLLRLNGEGEPARAVARARVRTVGGDVVWQADAVIDATLPAGAVARIDVPASVLRPDDYIVELRRGPAGADREWYEYVLRVRSKP